MGKGDAYLGGQAGARPPWARPAPARPRPSLQTGRSPARPSLRLRRPARSATTRLQTRRYGELRIRPELPRNIKKNRIVYYYFCVCFKIN